MYEVSNILLQFYYYRQAMPSLLLIISKSGLPGTFTAIFSPSLMDSGNGFPRVSGSMKERTDAMDTPSPNITGDTSPPRRRIYGANIVPIRLITIENPIPILLTTVGKSSAVNRCRMVNEQFAQNLPKIENAILRYDLGFKKGCTIRQIPDNIRNIQMDLFRPKIGLSNVKMT